ncbi:Uncharacterised protein [Streptococcus pneumoniae]|jgi:hypothetical protein|uniref:Uncharacterized protein n=9 Tax=Streptococcus pneumoniae TaxID=1313 RepID=A0A0H2UQE2_STRPN|nr:MULTISPECIES: hypothetical protein [Streptococcus]EDK62198.1 hypothetical protein CGSSp11BS70_06880 [Streptococcus pneumoniae SP11-BS70]EDK78107.1 hypothetical protein CGSSp9BS68_10550 [Streptococcus pneumoniae SP9-BS68]EGI85129.1 hypothetical protein SPAR148_1259 [Streptococcus pneumoniae GA17545]EGJ14839.1 hypothetical protein SPAR69_1279 [Streptococcus pneumoniae GA41317]EGJ15856.1 hypothetical protein SPAR93_1384 [Streptococcus pneumoniae GA47368]EHD49619.1 hypothetical protein SPAR40_
MTNSVFSTMQDIENVATDIIKSYDNEIYTYKAVSQEELEKLEKSYDEKSHEELVSIESNLEMKQQNLIDEVNKTIKENDANIQYISSSRRGEFVEKIIGRVVEKYGH